MLFYGDPGVGKSSVMQKTLGTLAQALGEETGDEFVYVRSPVETHWNSFNPKMWAIILDDIASRAPNFSPNGDPSVMEIINLINSVCYSPDQASLEKKGKTPAIPRVVLATTNTYDMNARLYFQTESAARRRFPYVVTIKVKREFKLAGTDQLDPEAVHEFHKRTGLIAEPWLYSVDKMVVRNGVIIERPILVNVSCCDFYPWVAQVAIEQQASEKELALTMDRAWHICGSCYKPNCVCIAPFEAKPQAFDPGFSWSGNTFFSNPLWRDSFQPWNDIFAGFAWRFADIFTAINFCLHMAGCVPVWMTAYAFYIAILTIFQMLNSPNWAWVSIRRAAAAQIALCRVIWMVIVNILAVIQWNREVRAKGRKNFEKIYSKSGEFFWAIINIYEYYDCCLKYYTIITRTAISSWAVYSTEYLQDRVIMTKDKMRDLGRDMANSFYRNPKMVAGIVAALSVAAASCVLLRSRAKEGVSQVAEFSAPIPFKREKKNSYYNSDMHIVPLPQCDAPGVQDLYDKACRTISRSIFTLWVGNMRVCAVSLGGCDYLTVAHVFESDCDSYACVLKVTPDKQGINQNLDSFELSRSDIYLDPVLDRAIIRIVATPPRAKCDYIFDDADLSTLNHPGKLVYRDGTGIICEKPLLRAYIDRSNTFYRSRYGDTTSRKFVTVGQPAYACSTPTEDGMCGGIILIRSKSHGITCAGIHVCGINNTGHSVQISRDFLSRARDFFPGFTIPHAGAVDLSIPEKRVTLGAIHAKAPVRFQEHGTATVYGTTDLPRATPKSQVMDTLMRSQVEKIMDLHTDCVPPDLKTPKPKALALEQLIDPVIVNTSIIDICADALFERYKKGLSEAQLRTLKPYDMFTTINGHAGVAYVDAMKFSTSAGFPRNRSKNHYTLPDEPRESAPNPRKFDDSIMDEVEELRARYARGERGNIVFRANLKDEAVSAKKQRIGKTRVFAGAPISYSILARQYFLSFIRLAQNNPFLFESAVGINATSSEWGDLRTHMVQFGENRMIAGDFKAYDKRIPSAMLLAAFNVWIRLAQLNCTESGSHPDGTTCYSPKDIQVMIGIATDTAFPLMDFFGELIQFNGSNPSGHPLTVTKNGTCNSLYMRLVWYYAKPEGVSMSDFDKYVTLMTYGDDNILNVHSDVDYFDHTVIANVLATHDVVYTMADKESVSVPFINIDQIDFLKRSFVVDDDLDGFVRSPLDMASISKMLLTHVASNKVVPEHQCADILRSANREFFFHGKDVFDKRHKQLKRVAEESGLATYFEGDRCLPDFSSIKASIDFFQDN
jgi:hypothetical protein